jgi:GTPase SAR1 family protein
MLNEDQQLAANEIIKFLLSDKKEFVLTGSGGTGKSYLLKYLQTHLFNDYVKISNLYGEPEIKHIKFTAMTHKAVAVLLSSINDEIETLHSFLHLKVNNDFKTGDTYLTKNNIFQFYKNTLLIIDEASMIDYKIKKYIDEAMIDPTNKIIYVGDDKQLLAVKSPTASVFTSNKTTVQLNTLVRAAENIQLQELINKLKHNVTTSTIEPIEELAKYVNVIGKSDMKDLLEDKFKPMDHNGIILAYQNKTVQKYNAYIRSLRGLHPTRFDSAEIVLNNHYITLPGTEITLNTDTEVFLANIDYSIPYTGNSIYNKYGLNLYSTFNSYRLTDDFKTRFRIILPEDYNQVKLVLDQLAKTKSWQDYYFIKETLPHFTSKDARTVHKSQGSTFDFAVVDYWDLIDCKQLNTLARLLYVAVSRAKKDVYIYDYTKP